MDYQKLLKKYIDFITIQEGVSFIDDWCREEIVYDGIIFTDEEWKELEKLDKIEIEQPDKVN